jgi:hypothetical protein
MLTDEKFTEKVRSVSDELIGLCLQKPSAVGYKESECYRITGHQDFGGDQLPIKEKCDGTHDDNCDFGKLKFPNGKTKHIQFLLPVILALLMVAPPNAQAAPQWVENFETKHPKLAFITGVRLVKTACFAVKHPKQFGKQCEEDGTNGLFSFVGAAANIGTTAIVGAKRF